MAEESGAAPTTNEQVEEARLIFQIREAHSKALREAASKLQANGFDRHLRPLKGKVDVDLAALAAKVVERVVERSEEGFNKLCDRMAVNEKLLALERRRQRPEARNVNGMASRSKTLSFLVADNNRPLPGGGLQLAEFVRETTMRLKEAERVKLLALTEEAERQADAEAATVAEIEAALEKKLAEVAETQQALTEAARCLP